MKKSFAINWNICNLPSSDVIHLTRKCTHSVYKILNLIGQATLCVLGYVAVSLCLTVYPSLSKTATNV